MKKGWYEVNISNVAFFIDDCGGRRSGIDRRTFSYSDYIPERRANNDRRDGEDRRSGIDRRSVSTVFIGSKEKRNNTDRRRGWSAMPFS